MGYTTTTQFDRVQVIPISLPQTEMRRQRSLQVTTITVKLGQVLELRSINLHLVKILTSGVTPLLSNTTMGLVSAGLYLGESMTTGGLGLVTVNSPGAACYNSAQPVRVTSPGVYTFFVTNNSSNVDVTVVLTASARLFT